MSTIVVELAFRIKFLYVCWTHKEFVKNS